MKAGIHPEYQKALITCACGRVSETRSTVGELHVEICSHCHPFFTGRQKLVDTAGRVERFMMKYGMEDEAAEIAEEVAERAEAGEALDLPEDIRAANLAAAEAAAAARAARAEEAEEEDAETAREAPEEEAGDAAS